MMDHSAQLRTTDQQSSSLLPQEDDDTVVTPPKGEKSRARSSVVEEKTLKFRFPSPTGNDGSVNPLILHIHWMHEVRTAFGDSVVFFDNNNRKIEKLDPLRTKLDSPPYHFAVHNLSTVGKTSASQSNPTRFILHRMQSQHSLRELKNAPNVANLMQKYDFYVNDHRWCETDWDTNQLGFFYGIDPQFYDLDQAMCIVQDVIKKNAPRMKPPKFRLVYCSPKVRTLKGSNRTIRTKAYAVETLRKDRDNMTRILKQAYKDDGTFVPFQMRSRHPEAFEKMIRAQTHRVANNFVIILNYVGPDVMHYISERILKMDGVQAVLPCKSVNNDGKFKILVHKDQYHAARDQLMDELTTWIDDNAAPDAKATLIKYQSPPEVAPINSDGFSRGEHSYMNLSVNTALSVGSALSDESPPAYVFHNTKHQKSSDDSESMLGGSQTKSANRTRTWADRVAGHSTSVTEDLDIGQPSIFDQSTIISDLESSRAEVETLKYIVAQLEAERAEQKKALSETVQQQVSKAVQDQMSLFTVQMTQMFANLVSTLHQAPGTLSKRSAQDMEAEVDIEQLTGDTNSVTSKRWDNKNTPTKQLQRLTNMESPEWKIPDSTPPQKSQTRRDQEMNHAAKTLPTTLILEMGAVVDMSRSDDDDITMNDSGNESNPKSLTSLMEAEANSQKNDRI